MSDPATLLDLCRRNGLRLTGQRRLIAELITSAADHPDVNELHRRALARDPTLSLSTVYRTLKQFAEIGAIAMHTFDRKRVRIEQAPREHHDHLVDIDSGAVIEFTSPEIEALQTEIARRLGYVLTGHRLELYGRRIRQPAATKPAPARRRDRR